MRILLACEPARLVEPTQETGNLTGGLRVARDLESTDEADGGQVKLAIEQYRPNDPVALYAYVNAGVSGRSPALIVRGYRMLTEVQRSAPDDVSVLRGIGRALPPGKEPLEALRFFEREHLERAMTLDPLLLPAATALQEAYRKQDHKEKADALANRMRLAMRGKIPN